MQNERNENQDEAMSFFSIGAFFKLFKTKQASIIKTTSITHEEKRASNIKKTNAYHLKKQAPPHRNGRCFIG